MTQEPRQTKPNSDLDFLRERIKEIESGVRPRRDPNSDSDSGSDAKPERKPRQRSALRRSPLKRKTPLRARKTRLVSLGDSVRGSTMARPELLLPEFPYLSPMQLPQSAPNALEELIATAIRRRELLLPVAADIRTIAHTSGADWMRMRSLRKFRAGVDLWCGRNYVPGLERLASRAVGGDLKAQHAITEQLRNYIPVGADVERPLDGFDAFYFRRAHFLYLQRLGEVAYVARQVGANKIANRVTSHYITHLEAMDAELALRATPHRELVRSFAYFGLLALSDRPFSRNPLAFPDDMRSTYTAVREHTFSAGLQLGIP